MAFTVSSSCMILKLIPRVGQPTLYEQALDTMTHTYSCVQAKTLIMCLSRGMDSTLISS